MGEEQYKKHTFLLHTYGNNANILDDECSNQLNELDARSARFVAISANDTARSLNISMLECNIRRCWAFNGFVDAQKV